MTQSFDIKEQPLFSPVSPSVSPKNNQTSFPSTIWILGGIMFLMNLSFVMVYSFSGVYLKSILKTSVIWVGLLEGIAEASSFAMKLFSGVISDYAGRRKSIMISGYILTVLSRPLLAVGTFAPVFCARLMERVGNGIQATPRDAMVADIADPKRIGASYGLKRSLATMGSFFGAVCGMIAMHYTNENYQHVFAIAAIPPVFAIIILIFFVKEPKKCEHSAVSSEVPLPTPKRKHRLNLKNILLLGNAFWALMAVNAVFMLARMGETFLSLHAHSNLGLQAKYLPIVMMFFNLGWCVSSYPVGVMADRMNRYWFLSAGIIFLVLADLTLASATNLYVFFLGVLLWGIQYGVTQNIFISLIAETVPENLRGTAFGFYYIITATCTFFADTSAGIIAHHFGEGKSFFSSGIVALLSLLTLVVVLSRKKRAY